LGSGHGAHCAAGHAGQALGSGHFTTGQRGRGQGGHSPILQGLEHVDIHGAHFGTEDFNTYLDISGCGGHSVFNIYLDISGIGGQGGTVAFNTHLLGSGSGHSGHWRVDVAEGFGGHGHGRSFLQRPHMRPPLNPSASLDFCVNLRITAITATAQTTAATTIMKVLLFAILLWVVIFYNDSQFPQ